MSNVGPTKRTAPDERQFPLRLFTLVLGFSLLMVATSAALLSALDYRFHSLVETDSLITQYAGRVMLLDEGLTISARMAAATGNIVYIQRYSKLTAERDSLIRQVGEVLRNPNIRKFVQQTDDANRKLVAIERRALSLASDGQRATATNILVSAQYARLKDSYAEGVAMTVGSLQSEADAEWRSIHLLAIGVWIATVVIVIALISSLIFAVRAERSWSRQRLQSEAALAKALEDRELEVIERTSDLTEAQSLAQVGSFSVDLSNNRARWSNECFKILGFDPQAVAPSFETYLARIHPDDRRAFDVAHRNSLDAQTEASLEQQILLNDGKVRVVQQRWRHQYGPDGKPLKTTGTIQDITERKVAENTIIQERDFSNAMIGSLPGLFALIDECGRLMRWNDNMPALTGLSDVQLQGADVSSLVVESDREMAQAKISEAFNRDYVDVVLGVPANAGDVRIIHWAGRSITNDGKRALIAIGIDETEERATQSKLKASEERFRSVTDAAQDAIIIIDSAGTINYWNLAASRILGYSAEEAFGKNVHEWLTPERFREKAFAGMKKFVATGRGDVLDTTTELAALRKDGVEIPIELSVGAMQLGTKLHAVAILRDIAERKRTEERIAYLARHDDLTGLVNRAAFADAVKKEGSSGNRVGDSARS